MTRLPVKKTYKLYLGGAFPRSESGRTYEVDGANVALASRKDVRDAVRAARDAFPRWAGMTAYNRGQVLYRVAEMMEGRKAEFAELTGDAAEVDAAVDRWVWYAGWADKLAQVLGASNPVAGPYFNFTVPEPTGVVGIVAAEEPPLLGLVSRLAPPKYATEAFTWSSTFIVSGLGAGMAVGGYLAEHAGLPTMFLSASALIFATISVTL